MHRKRLCGGVWGFSASQRYLTYRRARAIAVRTTLQVEVASQITYLHGMFKLTVYWYLLVAFGVFVSVIASGVINGMLDQPRGAPLSRLGLAGTVTQIGLMLFPLLFAPAIMGLTFLRSHQRKPRLVEILRLGCSIGFSGAVVWFGMFLVSGVWFGVIHGGNRLVATFLAGPPLLATATVLVVFPLSAGIFAARSAR